VNNPLERERDVRTLDECLVYDGIRQACSTMGVSEILFCRKHEDEVFSKIEWDRDVSDSYARDMDIVDQAYNASVDAANLCVEEDLEPIPF